MNNESEVLWSEWLWRNLNHHPGNSVDPLSKITKYFSHRPNPGSWIKNGKGKVYPVTGHEDSEGWVEI